PPREPADGLEGQVGEVDLAGGQRVIPRDRLPALEEDLGHRQVLLLVLKGLGRKPVVDSLLARSELPARVVAAEGLDPEPRGETDPAHDSPRMTDPSRRWASVSSGGAASAFQKASCSSGVNARV